MKTLPPPRRLSRPVGVCLASLCSFVLAGVTFAEEPATILPKDYTLFVGLDVEVPWETEHRPIRRLVNRNRGAEISVDGDLHEVSINRSETIRLKRSLKVGRQPANIANFNAIRTYSPGNDPFRQWARVQVAVESQNNERLDMAQFDYTQSTLSTTNPAMQAQMVASIEAMQRNALNNLLNQTNKTPDYDFSQISQRLSSDTAAEQYDAIEATFELSAPVHVADVFMVLLADYTVPGRKDEIRRLIYTRTIGPVGPEPRREIVWTAGLPMGFELHDTRVYLYSFGEEIPTNLSEKTIGVSREEAVQLMLADHLARHRGRTVPAEPIWLTAPANFRDRLDPSALPANAELRIDADGKVTEVLDANGQPLRVVGLARDVLTTTRYLPALENGSPVASTLKVAVPKFLR